MKEKFREFYKLSQEEITDFWQNAIFSFDANILLNLYRYTEDTRNEFLETLEYLSEHDRLWISYQAAFEYQKNRLTVITSAKNAYKNLIEKLAKKNDEIGSVLSEFKKHQNLNIDTIKETFTHTFEEVKENLQKLDEEHPDLMEDDPIFEALTQTLDGCVGDSMNEAELNSIFKEGRARYEKKIPPGYMDLNEKKNEPEQSLYGDLIIWKELIKKIKADPSKLIFVTDDLKEDWWYIFNGKTIDSRTELTREFFAETNNDIIIYKPEQFLKFYKEKIRNELKEETIKEVEETRKSDELLSIQVPKLPFYNQYNSVNPATISAIDAYRARESINSDWLKYQTSGTTNVQEYISPEWAKNLLAFAPTASYFPVEEPDWLKRVAIIGSSGSFSIEEPDWLKRLETLTANVKLPDKEYSEEGDIDAA